MENKKFFSTHLSKKIGLTSVTVLTVFASYGALNAHATPDGANVVSTTNTQSDMKAFIQNLISTDVALPKYRDLVEEPEEIIGILQNFLLN